MSGILEGVRVIDLGHYVATPAAASFFADWGADVIKVEPLQGEMARGLKKSFGLSRYIEYPRGKLDWSIQMHDRNKRGLAIDLKQDEGKEILYELVKKSDVFMSNYELGTLKKLGMDYDTLRVINPRLIYAFNTAYGSLGPDKDERGWDESGIARSGFQYVSSDPDGPPPMGRPAMADRVAASHIAAGILAALWHRERTGEGELLECSLYHSMVWVITHDIHAELAGRPYPRLRRTEMKNPLLNIYRTRDGRWFKMVMGQSDTYWPSVCRALGKTELENDSRFVDMDEREKNCRELIQIFDGVFATRDLAKWEESFRDNNCIFARVQTPSEVVNDEQAIANGFFPEIDHPAAGPIKLVATPVKFHQHPASVKTPAPEVGQHNEEILLEMGYSWDQIVQLKNKRTIL